MRKRLIFSSIACLLLLSFTFAACAEEEEVVEEEEEEEEVVNYIKIGVIGPMQFVQGEHHWLGAEMARDEINDAGGIVLNGEKYLVELVKADSNEILSVTDASATMERLLTVDKVDFVVGGFRTEAVFPMQDVAVENQKIFICCGSSTPELCEQVAKDYDTYKYFFRGTPFNSVFLVGTDFLMLEMVGNMLKEELGIEGNLRVAIIAEKLVWADPMVLIAQARLPAMGMDVVGTWRPSDTATDVTAELTAIAAEEPHIIFTTFSGPVGVTYAKQWGELEIPACSVGINVEAQKLGFLEATGGKANYEMTLNTYARGVKIPDLTLPFVEAFVEKTGEIPTYTAGTYDTILNLVNIVEEQQTLDADTLIPYVEATDFVGTSGRVTYFPNDARPPAYPHDLVWGAGYLTGIATQWQDEELKCVWPWGWEGITYEGTVQYKIPPRVIEKFGQ